MTGVVECAVAASDQVRINASASSQLDNSSADFESVFAAHDIPSSSENFPSAGLDGKGPTRSSTLSNGGSEETAGDRNEETKPDGDPSIALPVTWRKTPDIFYPIAGEHSEGLHVKSSVYASLAASAAMDEQAAVAEEENRSLVERRSVLTTPNFATGNVASRASAAPALQTPISVPENGLTPAHIETAAFAEIIGDQTSSRVTQDLPYSRPRNLTALSDQQQTQTGALAELSLAGAGDAAANAAAKVTTDAAQIDLASPSSPASFDAVAPSDFSSLGIGAVDRAGDAKLKAPATQAAMFEVVLVRQRSENEFELRLDPPDLGPVTISFYEDDAGTRHASISSDQGATLDLLRRHADLLQRELSRQGAGDFTLDFSHHHDDTSSSGDARRRPNPPRSETTNRVSFNAAPLLNSLGADRIDLVA